MNKNGTLSTYSVSDSGSPGGTSNIINPWNPYTPNNPFVPQVSYPSITSTNITFSNVIIDKFEEVDGNYVLEIEMPGIKKTDVNVSVDVDVLDISWVNRKALPFFRNIEIPELANKKSITAKLEDGILTVIAIKMSKPKSTARTIKIE